MNVLVVLRQKCSLIQCTMHFTCVGLIQHIFVQFLFFLFTFTGLTGAVDMLCLQMARPEKGQLRLACLEHSASLMIRKQLFSRIQSSP